MDILTDTLTGGALFVLRTWVRYLVLCGGAFVLFWVLLADRLKHRLCQPTRPTREILRAELKNSLTGIVFFVMPTTLAIPLYRAGHLNIDIHAAPGPVGVMLLTLVLFIIGADTWFYWVHRTLHDSRIYRWSHALHHLSEQPTPLASYSFSLVEGFMLGLYLPLVLLVVPINIWVMVAFMLFFALMEAYVHLGYEILPPGFVTNPLTKWLGTSVFHNMHHQHPAYNFAVYFTWWDHLMGTTHPDYVQRFQQVTAQPLLRRPG